MNILKKSYYHIKGEPYAEDVGIGKVTDNYIKADVYYSEGGYSLFTYKQTPRAYFMSVCKVGRGKDTIGFWESTSLFGNDGAKMLLFEVGRQSKKKAAEAEKYFNENIERYLRKVYPDLELEKEE